MLYFNLNKQGMGEDRIMVRTPEELALPWVVEQTIQIECGTNTRDMMNAYRLLEEEGLV